MPSPIEYESKTHHPTPERSGSKFAIGLASGVAVSLAVWGLYWHESDLVPYPAVWAICIKTGAAVVALYLPRARAFAIGIIMSIPLVVFLAGLIILSICGMAFR